MTALVWLASIAVGMLTAHTAVNVRRLRRPPARPSPVDSSVAVLLPVRDEAHRVADGLRGLLAQRGVRRLSIVVLDDGSSDGTADVVRAVAGDRVTRLTGRPTPPGWLGKPYACQQLADQAPADATILVFVDADVVLAPDAVAAAVALLDGFDLLSPYPRLDAVGWAERLVQPLLAWSWLTFLPLRAMERSPRPSLAAAGGQFLVLDRAGYQRAGGHAAVRDQVLEDVALARAVKRSGGRIALAAGHRIAHCRMYNGWSEVRDGYTKSLWAAFGWPVPVLLTLLYLYVGPLALAVWHPVAGLLGYLLAVAGRGLAGRATGTRVWPDALAQPLSIVVFGYLLVRSYRHRHRDRIRWKGRPVR